MRYLMSTIAVAAAFRRRKPRSRRNTSRLPCSTTWTLSPVEERLPTNPRVREPLNQPGTYGGTLRRGGYLMIDYMTENFTREAPVHVARCR